ncbi:30S ribosomal protein S7 [Candidatus Campbellbacteria bacterium CG11_big_fil_rev_8_21_14_0_20_44_21]|uniref:Small ribosomal subunit protein uS7 n=1 Tax=Candidatus Campbellbacteria bacterium CG22_combo_CG10-13_8_21_14_all_43_18 TaxID=1974530 RepID=A0A2H0DWC3_9BACT|nr:MAG: 30S ribosomal protein S7 [Candidatus Campbellbacteria bacterium CG22_combo_CG10-13_8_21_14_all_43_18]PIR24560.1 MAG: 30S ribosomal protein S7 [Candidatus Campbellbacteria bacterium CG11_big_fil_rev_8_21_14_0_20_44_21]
MRRKIKNRNKISPDIRFSSLEIEKLINYVMERGKKEVARKIVYGAFDEIKEEAKADPLEIFQKAVANTSPSVEVRSKRVGGANYQIPREVRPERRLTLALRWIIQAAKSKKGSPMRKKLSAELLLASRGEGEAVKKKENTHRMAEANKAFAHFGW